MCTCHLKKRVSWMRFSWKMKTWLVILMLMTKLMPKAITLCSGVYFALGSYNDMFEILTTERILSPEPYDY